ncbi:NADH-quinone oxidoreductase subunit G [Methylophaga sp. 42_25_T18]|nr:NADH-quinone oxidoreductase subunit G [Methylophaga sp. 42_25_T18]OUR86809.1 NADH-quinone oxidoreductase subunit G [Methylophaga sp. 42_8_T64]
MVNIEIDGIPLKVDSTKMIIQAADEAGIDIPRFCYHKKLSIAANCRMCLIEVDSARKALPACATPVTEGMKVFTHSKIAMAAQRGVMEFLLINHPLDCPICDQGGECELQDLSMGYGAGISRFNEGKRVVQDKNIGPLIQTDMTRCIQCTRCVRFGEEVAGIKELGSTGRGETMEIGTYIESSLISELSGNIIDLCPVGALTSKPFRYRARAWELTAHPSIAPHDAAGSHIEFHTRGNEVMRVVPRDNDSINESWISDRDRFSYSALTHEQRVTTPMIKQDGQWQETDWQTALQAAIDGLNTVKAKYGTEQIAGLISPTATLEEAYLFQKLLRGMDINNIDHRLREQSFADQGCDYNSEDWCLGDIDHSDDIVLVGCNIRAEQPIIAHRIRQAAYHGATVTNINFFATDLLMPVDKEVTVNAKVMLETLAGIATALHGLAQDEDSKWTELLADIVPTALEQTIAMQLANAVQATLFVGALANHHPQAAKIRALTHLIAQLSNSHIIVLPEANSKAVSLAGAMPEQQLSANGDEDVQAALNSQQMWQQCLRAYVLFGIEPEWDVADPAQAQYALHDASFVLSMNSYVTDSMLAYADVILPIASFAETSGTFIGIDGQWQSFTGAVAPRGESRPGWKVLRVLANLAEIAGIDFVASEDVRDEVKDQLNLQSARSPSFYVPDDLLFEMDLMAISEVPMYQIDGVVRRSEALQQTPANLLSKKARMNTQEAARYSLSDVESVSIKQNNKTSTVPFEIDDAIADGCIYLAAGLNETAQLAAGFSAVTITAKQVEVAD